MDQTQAAALRLSETVRARIEQLWDLHAAAQISRATFVAAATSLVAQANTAGVQLADVGLAAEVTRQLRQPATPIGLTPSPIQVDSARIARDIDRIVEAAPTTIEPADLSASRRSRLGDWARTEPLLTVATATQAGMVARGANGWVRQLDADPCRLCVGWADDVVRAPTTRMKRHNGCGCIQRPVFSSDVSADDESVIARSGVAAQNPVQALDNLIADLNADLAAQRLNPRPQRDTTDGFTFL